MNKEERQAEKLRRQQNRIANAYSCAKENRTESKTS